MTLPPWDTGEHLETPVGSDGECSGIEWVGPGRLLNPLQRPARPAESDPAPVSAVLRPGVGPGHQLGEMMTHVGWPWA